MSEEGLKPNPDDVRTEYTALISFHNSVVGYRFTLLGFYLAAVGIIAGRQVKFLEACLILGLTLAMYIMELRNRSLYAQMGQRAMYIEMHYWGLNRASGEDKGLPLFSAMRQNDLPKEIRESLIDEQKKQHLEKPRLFGRLSIPVLPANHSKGLDLLYLVVALYAAMKMVFG